MFKATQVDGVYDSDPAKNPNAKRYESLSFSTVLGDNLGVIDATAASLCKENSIPLLVFDIKNPNNIVRALKGEKIGTIIKEEL